MNAPQPSSETVELRQKEIEVKYLVDPSKFPPDLYKALVEGKDHDDILRKGRISQLYLPVDAQTTKMALEAIQKNPLSPLSEEDIAFFSDPANVTEIRILQREQDHIPGVKEEVAANPPEKGALVYPDAFQITIKGKSNEAGTVRRNIETPISVGPEVAQCIVDLLEYLNDGVSQAWQNKVSSVEKMWYDIKMTDPDYPLIHYTAELDVFPDLEFLAVAEVEFENERKLEMFNQFFKPEWFSTDITSDPSFKVRNLAGKTFDELSPEVHELMGTLRDHLQKLYLPTILGNEIPRFPQNDQDTYVVLGSFKRWLPQFRRISQDLKRMTGGVYPPISTLDIARRHVATNDPKAAFRIEAEETQPLKDAEKAYLQRIKAADGVFLVAPERRLGESSAYETQYALAAGKKLYLANNLDRASDEIDMAVRAVILMVISRVMDGQEDVVFSETDLGEIIRFELRKTFPTEFLTQLTHRGLRKLLKGSKEEDERRKKIESEEETNIPE
jgi:hypothetical protein